MLYDIHITYYDGSSEYLLGQYDNNNECLQDIQSYQEYRQIIEILILPQYKPSQGGKMTMAIYHDNLIIHFNPDNPEKFQVEHQIKNTKAYYRQMTYETHENQHIGVYRIQFPDAWLPEFITITETELDIQINHTPTRDRLF